MVLLPADRLYISDLAKVLNRRVNTIRGWERSGKLPPELCSQRAGELGWRHWTPEQALGIRKWMTENLIYPGSGLANFFPSASHVEEMLAQLREKRAA